MTFPTTLEKRRLWFVLTVMTIGIAILISDSLQEKGWVSAAWWGYGLSAVFFLYAGIMRDQLLLRFSLFALTTGFAELMADAWLVNYTHTLLYPHPEPMLFASPAYMPFSWTVVLLEVGYIGWLVSKKWGLVKATVFLFVLGAVLVPLYERWAIGAGWWSYVNCPTLFDVPHYVIAAEGLLMLSIPVILSRVEKVNYFTIVLWGITEGVIMLLACMLAYSWLG